MIEELDGDPEPVPWRPPHRLLVALGGAAVAAAIVAALLVRGPVVPEPLALPSDVTDVELTTFPDWLANEPPAASLRAPVAIRATRGLASVEGVPTVTWTERGIAYRFISATRDVPDLVRIASLLR